MLVYTRRAALLLRYTLISSKHVSHQVTKLTAVRLGPSRLTPQLRRTSVLSRGVERSEVRQTTVCPSGLVACNDFVLELRIQYSAACIVVLLYIAGA